MKRPTINYKIGDLVQLTGDISVLVQEKEGHLVDFYPRDDPKFIGIITDIAKCVDYSEVTVMIENTYYYIPTWNEKLPSLILLSEK